MLGLSASLRGCGKPLGCWWVLRDGCVRKWLSQCPAGAGRPQLKHGLRWATTRRAGGGWLMKVVELPSSSLEGCDTRGKPPSVGCSELQSSHICSPTHEGEATQRFGGCKCWAGASKGAEVLKPHCLVWVVWVRKCLLPPPFSPVGCSTAALAFLLPVLYIMTQHLQHGRSFNSHAKTRRKKKKTTPLLLPAGLVAGVT